MKGMRSMDIVYVDVPCCKLFIHYEAAVESDDGFVDDPVTLISRLDMSDLLHLHPNDSTALIVVSIKLKGTENFQWDWANTVLPRCTCHTADEFKKHNQLTKLMHFLMGLDDSYMQIRSSILSREALPDVKIAYATISSEESHRVASGSISGSSQMNQASAFVSNVPNKGNFQRNETSNNGPKPNNVNNNKQNGGSGLVCENCCFNGHTIDRCFKIIGYPTDFGKKKLGRNVKGKNISNNSSVGSSSSSGFTNEQMATLISLIKDNKSKMISNGKIVDSWANQHMTNTDMELDNVYDISHLKIKVGHPNGTEAFISKIENLKLPNRLVLFDVLVVLEYCVTLISGLVTTVVDYTTLIIKVLKVICVILPIPVVCLSMTGTADLVILAKHTREPFPLSDHTSSKLDDLVHLDLWGPYKVTSSEGFRYFLTIVDDYTRAVLVYLIKSKDELGSRSEKCVMIGYSNFKKGYRLYSLDKHQFIFSRDVKFFESVFPFKDTVSKKVDTSNVFQDINHIIFFDSDYPKMSNDDERVDPNLNSDYKSQSDSSHSFVPGGGVDTTDFPSNNSRNDADSSDDIFDTQITTLEDNIISEGDLNQNPSTSTQGTQTIRRSSRQSVSPRNYNDFVVESKVKHVLEKYFFHWTDAMINEMDALLRNDTWDIVDLPKDVKAIGSFGQKEEIDYEEIFSPVVKIVTVRCLLNIVVSNSWHVFQFDVNNVFLYSDLVETVYMKPPEGYFSSGYICLNQRKYVLDLLSEYGMLACKLVKTPLMSKLAISNEATNDDRILDNITNYQKLMGKLFYLTNTRPDISYDVYCLRQFMYSPLKSHLKISFKILRYYKSCPRLGIHIVKSSGMSLKAFSDDDWAKYVVTRRLVTGYCVFLMVLLFHGKAKSRILSLSPQLK
ncbi:ribonuclease H-like domain-containing protein [Tanacetum coccineum]